MKVLYFGSYNPEYPRNRILIDGLRQNGVEVVELCERSRWYRKFFSLYKQHRQYRHSYDVMVVGFPGFVVMPLARLISTGPVVFDAFLSYYDSHVFDRQVCSPRSFKALYYYLLDWVSCRLADKVLLDTNEHISYFVETFYLPRDKFVRIYVGAHDAFFKPGTVEKTARKEHEVLFWGWMIPLHGISYIMQAAALLKESNIHFTIVGSGPEKAKAVSIKNEHALNNVSLIDGVEQEELLPYIHRADVCLGIFGDTPKTLRVIPNKVYEALACKKALITADTPAARELLVDNKHCLFARVADSGDLAQKITVLISDSTSREKLAEEGHRLYTEHLTPQKVSRELITTIKSLI